MKYSAYKGTHNFPIFNHTRVILYRNNRIITFNDENHTNYLHFSNKNAKFETENTTPHIYI